MLNNKQKVATRVIRTVAQTVKRTSFVNHQLAGPLKMSFGSSSSHCLGVRSPGLSMSVRFWFSYRSQDSYIDLSKNYYEILQVQEKATLQQIKLSFYLLAKKYHPDKTEGDESIFKQLNEAYNVLSQPHLRKQYDENRSFASETEEQTSTTKQKPLNYEPYSQMSRMQWAYYRHGTMEQSKVDYRNFTRTSDPEKAAELDFKEQQQWNRAYRSIKPEQIEEQNAFREKLFRKFKEDMIRHKEARQQFYEERFNKIGEKVERVLGKWGRRLFNRMISK